jgi:methylmalonyl-CoA/ethylmalonyl-CoA epimerase
MKFDHIGIVVENMADGAGVLRATFGIEQWSPVFEDHGIGVSVQFGRDPSGICYELVAPLRADSPVSRALGEGVNIINHVAYLVGDLDSEARRLRKLGFFPASRPAEALAYDGARIQFFVSEMRMIVELIEAIDHRHAYASWAERYPEG